MDWALDYGSKSGSSSFFVIVIVYLIIQWDGSTLKGKDSHHSFSHSFYMQDFMVSEPDSWIQVNPCTDQLFEKVDCYKEELRDLNPLTIFKDSLAIISLKKRFLRQILVRRLGSEPRHLTVSILHFICAVHHKKGIFFFSNLLITWSFLP